MIVKTRWYPRNSMPAGNLVKYIEKGLYKNKTLKELYIGYRPMTQRDFEEFVNFSRIKDPYAPALRHVILSPEKSVSETDFYWNILKTMHTWIMDTRRYSVRYVWGLHYNTEHPHAHIAMVAAFPEELVMYRKALREFNKIVERVFEEKVSERNKEQEMEVEKELHEAEEFEVEM